MTPSQKVDQWRERLHDSRAQGVGFAAPGGFFTRSLYEAILLKNIAGIDVLPHLKDRPYSNSELACITTDG